MGKWFFVFWFFVWNWSGWLFGDIMVSIGVHSHKK